MDDDRIEDMDDRRFNDMNIVRLDQKFDDHSALVLVKLEELAQWQREHDTTSEAWRKKIEDRIVPFEDFKNQIKTPAKVMGIIVVMILTPFFGALGVYLFGLANRWLINRHP